MPMAAPRRPVAPRTEAEEIRDLQARQAATESLLAATVRRLDAFEARQQRQAGDPVRDAQLFGAIAASFGAAVFGAGDLLRLATHDPELDAAIRGLSVRSLGVWLRRLRGKTIGGYRLARIGRNGDGVIWSLYVADEHAQGSYPDS
jgi:hypothetical protein